MLQVKKLAKEYGTRVLFEDATFSVTTRERIGLVGRNGSGKSTLFKLLLKEELASSGEILLERGATIGSLNQHFVFLKETLLLECEHYLVSRGVDYQEHLAKKILEGVGISRLRFEDSPNNFSGGQQLRIKLALTLLTNPTLLLLDEPTNYLDIVGVRWLRRFLGSYPGAVMIITHDRSFMDSVVTSVMGISRGKIKQVTGKTKTFYEQIELEEKTYDETRQNQLKRKKELEDFINRFKAKASKAKQAQARMKMIDKMDILDEQLTEASMRLRFPFTPCTSKAPLRIQSLSFGYTSEMIIKNFSYEFKANERVAIIGKNGLGKSTLLNLIAGELNQNEGNIIRHPSLAMAHFGQTNIVRLDLENDIVEEIYQSHESMSITQARCLAGAMLFSGDDAFKLISVLSGGERSRVLLAKLMAKPSNMLLLDEPTNHLDMQSIELLKEAIKEFEGPSLIVTHDEDLLRAIATSLIVFDRDSITVFNGTYDEFLEKVGFSEEDNQIQETKENKSNGRLSKQERAQLVQERSKQLSPLRNRSTMLENEIVQCEKKIAKINERLIHETSLLSGVQIAALKKELHSIEVQMEKDSDEFFEIGEKIELIEAEYAEKLN